MTAISHSWFMSVRDLRALWRQPWWIVVTLAQPLVYLLLFSAVFEAVAGIPGFRDGSYIDFFVPGIVVVTALFSGGWAGMNVINDLERGVMDRFLASPVRRGALIAGRLMQGAAVTVIQSLIVIGLGIAIGARLPGGVPGTAALILVAVLLGAAFAALSIALALVMRREETLIGAVQVVVLPLTFLSSAWMQRDLLPGWIESASVANPVEWATRAGREAVSAGADWALVLSQGGLVLAFALACAWVATRGFRSYLRSL